MRLSFTIVVLAAALGGDAAILDRIAVTVGKQVISETDVIRDVRVSAFLDQRPLDLSKDQKRKAADRLVDQILILQEAAVSRIPLSPEENAASMLDQVKAAYKNQDDYRAALARYGITEEDVSSHLLAGVQAMHYTDLRFRPEVQLSDDDLHDFYNTLAAEWRQKGSADVPTFDASRAQVEKLLTDQRTAQALDRWLGTQRNETQILYREQVFK
jgi:hypothetical protein